MTQQTAVEWFAEKLEELYGNDNPWFDIPSSFLEQAKQVERQQLFDAMMYALDEDGHTGEWKVKFINDYIDNL